MNRFVVYDGKKYAFDLKKIKGFCLLSDKETGKESEIFENYEMSEGSATVALTSKTQRTLKSTGNPQNDTIIYDLVKMFITTLLTNETVVFDNNDEEDDDGTPTFITLDFAAALSLNTMLEMGFIYEIND